MDYFYIKSNAFVALFKTQNKRSSCHVIPSKGLRSKIAASQSLTYEVKKVFIDEVTGEVEKPDEQMSDDEQFNLDEIMAEMEDPINLDTTEGETKINEQYFKLAMKEAIQIYQFTGSNVQVFFNLLQNYLGGQLQTSEDMIIEVMAPAPFLNCVYKEADILYE